MPAGITETDAIFTVRRPSWHGLETLLPDYPTVAQARAIAHPWEVEQEPLYRRVAGGDGYEEVPDFFANVRSDNEHLLGVVSHSYTNITIDEMYQVAEAIQGEGADVLLETGGSLQGGSLVWLLLRLNEPLRLDGDPHGETVQYYALQNAFDGSSSFRGQATSTRIVCQNTAKIADLDAQARGTEFTFRHTSGVKDRIEEARGALAGWRESVRSWRLVNEHLLSVTVTPNQQRAFVDAFVPMPQVATVSDRVVANVEEARSIIRGILAGPTCEGVDLTAYGCVQAVLEYQEHFRKARSAQSRFKRAYLDRSVITRDAVEIALEVAK